MHNVSIKTQGNKVVITADLSRKPLPVSNPESPNVLVASTKGNQDLVHNNKLYKIGLNIFTRK